MKVVISAGGRFHSIDLAYQLAKKSCLHKLFSFSYKKSDQFKINKDFVCSINSCRILDIAFQKLRLFHFINPSFFNFMKDNLFDLLVSKELNKIGNTDIFVGWANYSLKSLLIAKKIGAKTVIESGSCHIKEQQNLLEVEYEKWGLKFNPIYLPTLSKMIEEYNTADYIMTLSDFSYKSFIKQGVDVKKILKVPCGVDVDFFYNSVEGICKDNKFRVIFVGLANIRKGIPYLIEAWNNLNLPQNSTELIIVGNIQKDLNKIFSKLKISTNIRFFGSCDRVTLKKLYYSSTVFVLPSVEDGFGMVAGEAMSSGLPVICSKNTGVSEVIQDSIHGFLVEPQNSLALSEKILWCYKNQDMCRQMGALGKNHIINFGWDEYGKKVFNVYQDILRNK